MTVKAFYRKKSGINMFKCVWGGFLLEMEMTFCIYLLKLELINRFACQRCGKTHFLGLVVHCFFYTTSVEVS